MNEWGTIHVAVSNQVLVAFNIWHHNPEHPELWREFHYELTINKK